MNGARTTGRADAISFRQLRLFDTIGEMRSARRTSEACGLSQPAVTQSLAKLERELGLTLIDRRTSGSYLNEVGRILYARTNRFFDQLERAVIEAGAAASLPAAQTVANRLTRSQARALIGIVEQGSFERAAEVMEISPASLQRTARGLEGSLGIPLFLRTAAGLVVRPAGAVFGRRVKLALQEIDLGLLEVEAALGQTGQQILIGAMPFGGSVLLASALDGFLARHPGANLRIINDSSPEMAKSLRDGDVDLIIGLLPDRLPEEVVGEALAPTPYSVVVRQGHPLTQKGRVEVADLARYDWVVGSRGSSRRACFERLFAQGPKPRAQIETCTLAVLHHLIRHGDRLALMTSYELEHSDHSLRAVPLDPILPIPSLGVMTRAGWLPTRLHVDFLDGVRARVAAGPLLRAVAS